MMVFSNEDERTISIHFDEAGWREASDMKNFLNLRAVDDVAGFSFSFLYGIIAAIRNDGDELCVVNHKNKTRIKIDLFGHAADYRAMIENEEGVAPPAPRQHLN